MYGPQGKLSDSLFKHLTLIEYRKIKRQRGGIFSWILNIIYLFVYLLTFRYTCICLSANICTTRMLWPEEVRGGSGSLRIGVADSCESPRRHRELNLDPL